MITRDGSKRAMLHIQYLTVQSLGKMQERKGNDSVPNLLCIPQNEMLSIWHESAEMHDDVP